MGRRRDNGIVRRPIEYVLVAVAIVLVVVLLLSLNAINNHNNQSRTNTRNNPYPKEQIPTGSISEINASLEREFVDENSLQSGSSLSKFNAFQAAADDLGGVYDESNY